MDLTRPDIVPIRKAINLADDVAGRIAIVPDPFLTIPKVGGTRRPAVTGKRREIRRLIIRDHIKRVVVVAIEPVFFPLPACIRPICDGVGDNGDGRISRADGGRESDEVAIVVTPRPRVDDEIDVGAESDRSNQRVADADLQERLLINLNAIDKDMNSHAIPASPDGVQQCAGDADGALDFADVAADRPMLLSVVEAVGASAIARQLGPRSHADRQVPAPARSPPDVGGERNEFAVGVNLVAIRGLVPISVKPIVRALDTGKLSHRVRDLHRCEVGLDIRFVTNASRNARPARIVKARCEPGCPQRAIRRHEHPGDGPTRN